MRPKHLALVICWLTMAGCGQVGNCRLSLELPDSEARNLVRQIEIWVVPADAGECPDFISGQLVPGQGAARVLSQLLLDYPSQASGKSLADVPVGWNLFLAEGRGADGRKFLRGCKAAEVKATATIEVIVALEWVCKPVDEICGDGLDNDCDGDIDEGCVECQKDEDCQDANPCTFDFCTSPSCHHAAFPDGTWCSDGDACTLADACQEGECRGQPRNCSALDDQCNTGVCSEDECRAQPRPDGTGCNDGFFCTENDACGSGRCAGTPRDCGDGDECTEDACEEATSSCRHTVRPLPGAEGPAEDPSCGDGRDNDCDGLSDTQDPNCLVCTSDVECDDFNPCTSDSCQGLECSNQPVANGSSCTDGFFCTVEDSCRDGVCLGVERDCSAAAGPCQFGVCLEDGDRCELRARADDSPCDDGLFCTMGDRCQQGVCQGSARDCNDGDACTSDSCDEATASCRHQLVPVPGAEGLSVGATCSNGQDDDCDTLVDGADPDCIECTQDSQCNDSNPCTRDSCALGVCSNQALADGTACDDGLFCTIGDACQQGICGGGARDCSALADQCNNAACNEAQDVCQKVPRADGTPCDDALYCTVSDQCQGGQCRASARDCDDADACTADSCSEASSSCQHQLVPNPGAEGPPGHSSCQSGKDEDCDGLTDLADPDCYECQQDGDCSDGNPCTQDRCLVGVCTHHNLADGSACNDGLYCTSPDACQAGACTGPPRDCSSYSDACHQGLCDEQADSCAAVALPDGTACDDGLYCTVADACSAGACGGLPRDCTSLSDQCNLGVCDEGQDACRREPRPGNPSCNDAVFCTEPDACQAGTCTGPARNCSDGDVCTIDSCSESEQRCVHELSHQGSEGPAGAANCYDGQDNDCDGLSDQADGDCIDCTAPADCDDANPCTADICDLGVCQNPNLADGTGCDDGRYCTVSDACSAGLCQGQARDCSAVADTCHDGVCNEAQDACQAVVRPDGSPCDDGRFCTVSDSCQAGTCQGTARVCDDGDACTADSCPAGIDQCQFAFTPRPELQDWCANSQDEDCDGRADGCCLANGSYTPISSPGVGSNPWYMIRFDANRDGRPDLATVNRGDHNVTVLVSNGDGTFQATSYATGANPYGLAAADLDADGRVDLVVANNSGNSLSILWGQAAGGFGERQDLSLAPEAANPVQVVAADFNADGRLDLATANWGNSTAAVFLNQGGRAFSAPAFYALGATGLNTRAITSGDFDADGILDLALGNWNGGRLSLLFGQGSGGQGDGTFGAAVRLEAGSSEVNINAADFNEDGILDLAVVAMNDNAVNILLGNGSDGRGDGTFAARVAYTTGSTPVSAFPADLNHDGILDLLVAEYGTDGVSVMYGNGSAGRGDGTFGARQYFATAGQPTAAVALDADGDFILDLACSNYGPDNVVVLRGRGSGSRPDGSYHYFSFLPAAGQPRALLLRDFNGDNIVDVVLGAGTNPKLRFFAGLGSGGRGNAAFQAGWTSNTGQNVAALASGDVDGDRIPDLVTVDTTQKKIRIFYQDGSQAQGAGTFVDGPAYNCSGTPRRVVLADANRDTLLDLIWIEQPGGLGVRLGNGNDGLPNGTFASASLHAAGSQPEALAIGDLNRDGLPDAAVADAAGNAVRILLGQSNGSFSSAGQVAVGTYPAAVALADLNADGALDLAAANRDSSNVSVRFGLGNGSFSGGAEYPTGAAPLHILAARLDADGWVDLLTADSGGGRLSVLLGTGGGAFAAAQAIACGGNPVALGLDLLDWDGRPDAAVLETAGEQLLVFRGGGICTAP